MFLDGDVPFIVLLLKVDQYADIGNEFLSCWMTTHPILHSVDMNNFDKQCRRVSPMSLDFSIDCSYSSLSECGTFLVSVHTTTTSSPRKLQFILNPTSMIEIEFVWFDKVQEREWIGFLEQAISHCSSASHSTSCNLQRIVFKQISLELQVGWNGSALHWNCRENSRPRSRLCHCRLWTSQFNANQKWTQIYL
jgi:hypothetical protein